MYRSSTGDLAYNDDSPRRPERWDREKFERFRDRRGSHVLERDRFVDEEVFDRPRRHRTDIFDDVSETGSRALAPYRRTSVMEREVDLPAQRSARPRFIRRQSSLDTFDRRPLPRYGDHERERERGHDGWRPPVNLPIPLPIRDRHRSHARRGREDDFEKESFRDMSPNQTHRDIEVHRDRKHGRRHSRSRSHAPKSVARSSSTSSSSFEEVSPARDVGKRGRTRLPKRLVRKEAVVELDYPFEEEDDFIVIRRALGKDHIDKLIEISEKRKEVERTTYVYEDKTVVEPPRPHLNEHHHQHQHHASGHHAPRVRNVSPPRREIIEERIEESNHIGGPLTVLVPEERKMVRSPRDIHDEIRELEKERRLLKYEREGDYEIVERHHPKREIVRVEKDRKGRLALVRSTH